MRIVNSIILLGLCMAPGFAESKSFKVVKLSENVVAPPEVTGAPKSGSVRGAADQGQRDLYYRPGQYVSNQYSSYSNGYSSGYSSGYAHGGKGARHGKRGHHPNPGGHYGYNGGKGAGKYHHPKPSHPKPSHPKYPYESSDDDDCVWLRFDLQGFSDNANATFPENSDTQTRGVTYTYNGAIFEDADQTTPIGGLANPTAFITGVCQRFQVQQMISIDQTIAGGGQCQFTITSTIDGATGTLQIQGELFDIRPSTLAIVGGTDVFRTAAGSVTVTPLYGDTTNTGTDVFEDATAYFWDGDSILEICPPDHFEELDEVL